MKSKVHPTYKAKYRVANWPAYNQALVRRGDVTVWLSSDAIAAWTPRRSGRRGGQRRYSDLAIETALTLRLLYHLPLRQAEGFLHALFGMMRLDLSAPDYTTLSRRSQHLRRRLRPASAAATARLIRQMRLAHSRRAEQDDVLAAVEEAQLVQALELLALDGRLEGEIKLRQRLDGRQARGAHRGLQPSVVA